LPYIQTILAVIVQETNRYVQQDAQARNKQDITYSQRVSAKDLYEFLQVTVQMGHDHKPSMKLYWTKDKLCRIPFYSGEMSRDRFLTVQKYLHFADSENPPTEKIPITADYGKSDIFDILNFLNGIIQQ
jgi:hypothetical protein